MASVDPFRLNRQLRAAVIPLKELAVPITKRSRNTPPSVVARTLAILGTFDTEQPEQTLSQISRASGLPLSTTFRLLNQLTELGALARGVDLRYRIGPRLARLPLSS